MTISKLRLIDEFRIHIFNPISNFLYNLKIGISNLINWFNTIWNDQNYDYFYILEILRFKLNQTLNYFKEIDENSDYVKDYFEGDICNFIKWLDLKEFKDKDNENTKKILRSIETYIYALDILIACDNCTIEKIDKKLIRLYKIDEKFGDIIFVPVTINGKQYYRMKREFETEKNIKELHELNRQINLREDEIKSNCFKVLKNMFDRDVICRWWD
jgi:hypothetical protein